MRKQRPRSRSVFLCHALSSAHRLGNHPSRITLIPSAPADAATKGAITAFTKALAIDEAPNRVRVNSVSPGNIWTPLWKLGADAEADPVAAREAGERVQAMGRMGTVLETGRLCLCIAADMTFTTGIDHVQSGGAEIGYGLK